MNKPLEDYLASNVYLQRNFRTLRQERVKAELDQI